MARVRGNFINGTLTGAISSSDTTIDAAALADLPVVTSGDIAIIVLDPFKAGGGEPEIVYATLHTSGSTTATVLRGQEGTAARAHGASTLLINAPIASDIGLVDADVAAIKSTPGSVVSTAPPSALLSGGAGSTGTSTSVSRADHVHAVPVGNPSNSIASDAQNAGAATTFSRSDHVHGREGYETLSSALTPTGGTATAGGANPNGFVGVSNKVARADHAHYVLNQGIKTAMIEDLAVTTGKIANGSVNNDKVVAGSLLHGVFGTLTGNVSSTATPTADNHLTRKGYVDSVAMAWLGSTVSPIFGGAVNPANQKVLWRYGSVLGAANAGTISVSFGSSFPNGVIWIGVSPYETQDLTNVWVSGGATASGFTAKATEKDGTVLSNGVQCGFYWVAIGW